jgi:hypothetical protein
VKNYIYGYSYVGGRGISVITSFPSDALILLRNVSYPKLHPNHHCARFLITSY